MKAKFGLDLIIEQRNVTQNVSINSVEGMDNKLFKEVYNILDSVNKRIQKVLDKYYGVAPETPDAEGQQEQENDDAEQQQDN